MSDDELKKLKFEESVLNTYRSIGYLIAEIARVPVPEPKKNDAAANQQVPGMFNLDKIKNWIKGKLSSKKKPKAWSAEQREANKGKKRKSFDDVVKLPEPPEDTTEDET